MAARNPNWPFSSVLAETADTRAAPKPVAPPTVPEIQELPGAMVVSPPAHPNAGTSDGGLVDRVLTSAVCGTLGLFSKLVMNVMNTTTVYHRERLMEVLLNRTPGQGVVTVCNHVSAVDDPGAIVALIPTKWLFTPEMVRWTMCATDRCFKNKVSEAILRKGKVLPVERGQGVHQPFMDDIVAKLDHGDWVHMFPEGTRSRTGQLARARLGASRLIADAKITPVVVPFYHSGMHTILRHGQWVPVNVGQKLSIVVGDPVKVDDLIEKYRKDGGDERELHIAIAARITQALDDLRKESEELAAKYPHLAPSKMLIEDAPPVKPRKPEASK